MEAIVKALPMILQILGVLVLVEVVFIGYKIASIVSDIASVSKRIALLTDVSGWFGFFKKFIKK